MQSEKRGVKIDPTPILGLQGLRSVHSRPHCGRQRGRRIAADALRPTHCGRRIAADAQFAVQLWTTMHRPHHHSSLQSHIVVGFPMFHYRSASGRMRPTHRSDRWDHSPNRPHAADAMRPTMNAVMHFKSLSQMRPTRGQPTMNRPLIAYSMHACFWAFWLSYPYTAYYSLITRD